jgi:hypothetical protein
VTSRRFGTRARLVAVSVLIAGVAVLSACSAGKITQTSTQVAAVPGGSVDLGPIALRDLTVAYNGIQGYARGADAPLVVRIFNSGTTPVVLTKVTTDKAEQVVLLGGSAQPAATTPPPPSPSASASPSGSASPSASGRPTASAGASATITQAPTQAPGQSAFAITIGPGGYVLLVPGQGQYLALRGLKEPLTPGFVTNVSFTFDNGATTTVGVPFGLPTEAGPRASAEHGEAEE